MISSLEDERSKNRLEDEASAEGVIPRLGVGGFPTEGTTANMTTDAGDWGDAIFKVLRGLSRCNCAGPPAEEVEDGKRMMQDEVQARKRVGK